MNKPTRAFVAVLLSGVLSVPYAAAQMGAVPSETDFLKRAGNFMENCDARANDAGERPDPNFLCLAFVAGLIEGYTYAAVANGNAKPYCLVRPTSLVEMMDMMATVIDRGVPPTMPTAAVFHFILTVNFPCAPGSAQEAEAAPVEPAAEATPQSE